MRILFLSPWFPYPPDNGSKLRIYNLLRGLASAHDVSLIALADNPAVDTEIPELSQIGKNIQVVPKKYFTPDSRQALVGFFQPTPRSVLDTYLPEVAQRIEATLAQGRFDLVIASQIHMAAYRQAFAGVPALFEEVEVGILYEQFVKASSWPQKARRGLTWVKQSRYLARLLRGFGAATVVSEPERKLLQSQVLRGSYPLKVIPNCMDVSKYREVAGEPMPNSMIFTGSFTYYPNYNGMTWFLEHVFLRVRSEIPDATLTITGKHADMPLPVREHVRLTGFVDDVRPLIKSSWLSLAPIWQGGGTRLKILEAMALHTPVIATTKGAEGLDVRHGENILLADTPADFAANVLRLLRDADLRQHLAENAFRLVCEKYDWQAILPDFLRLAERVARKEVQKSTWN